MRTREKLSLLFIILIMSTHLRAQPLPETILEAQDYISVLDFFSDVPGLYSSFNKCLARGYSESTCHSVYAYCVINDVPLDGLAGAFIDEFALTQLFKVNCGDPNGICYACCFVPQSSYGCHTAFFKEDKDEVINCNAGYGVGTRQVGPTLVVDPDPEPGQPCISTPQTCEHLAICNVGLSAEQIAGINEDPGHILKSGDAVNSRARYFGTGILADWSDYLSRYHTSAPVQSDVVRQYVHPFSTLSSFVTGRGCAGWRHRLPSSFPTDWSEAQFKLLESSGAYADEASHYNGLRQLGLVRAMSSIPNLFNRLAFVESRIWTPDTISQYLASTPDPDQALLQHMSPLGLEILKKSTQLQDYRLLAVPLSGETVSPRLFNGCLLGDPPTLSLTVAKRDSLGVDLTISVGNTESSSGYDVELLIMWGDGSVTRLTAPPGDQTLSAMHDYATGGRYQMIVFAQNEAGLRTTAGVVAETTDSSTNLANTPIPVLTEIQLVDLQAVLDSFAGNTMTMLFELEAWPAADKSFALGVSSALPVPLNTTVRFGTIIGWNMRAAPLQSVTIRPSRFGEGFLIGFHENYFTLDRLRIGVYSTQDNRPRYLDVPVSASMVRLYPSGSSEPILMTQPTYTPDGRLKIPVQAGGVRYTRVDLVFPASIFTEAVQGPVTDPDWTGITATFSEITPIDDRSQLSPPPLTAPASLLARASGTQISLTWPASLGADHYEVFRSSLGGPFALVASTDNPAYLDTGRTSNRTYLYKVRAVSPMGVASNYSDLDLATTIVFADDPLKSNITTVRATHVAQARTAVNAVRAAAGLAPFVFTDTAVAGSSVKAIHVQELRSALDTARATLGVPSVTYTNMLAHGTTIHAADLTEIRDGVK